MSRVQTVLVCLAVCLCWAVPLHAQAVVAPSAMTFLQSNADYAATLSARLEFFQCASVTPAGVCVGQAATPFQAAVDVPKAQIQTLATPNSFGNNRSFSLTQAPASGVLQATPAGVPFVATLQVIGDPAQGSGNSVRSAASNPFFGSGRNPAAVGSLRVQ